MKRIISAGLLGLALAGCAPATPPVSRPVATQTICGNMANPPIRIDDRDCALGRPDSRVYAADPNQLDYDDYTALGEEIDDDYLGAEDDDGRVLPWLGGSSATTTRRAPTTTRAVTPTTTRATPTTTRSAPRTTAPTTTRRR